MAPFPLPPVLATHQIPSRSTHCLGLVSYIALFFLDPALAAGRPCPTPHSSCRRLFVSVYRT
eukprot:3196588-Prymnesium_polylepis.2